MFQMRRVLETILLLYLAAAAIRDIKTRAVPLRPALYAAGSGILLRLAAECFIRISNAAISSDILPSGFAGGLCHTLSGGAGALTALLLSCLTGMLPGVFLLAAAWITRQEIGYGDGVVLLVIGLYLGFSAGTGIFLTALLLLSPVSLFYIAVRKAGRKKRLPFVPYLLAGYLLWLAVSIF